MNFEWTGEEDDAWELRMRLKIRLEEMGFPPACIKEWKGWRHETNKIAGF